MKLLLLGATGLVGSRTLDLALADPRVSGVVAPARRALPEHPKLLAPVVDFERLPDAPWWQADAVICALGTTLRIAKSRERFRQVDHGMVLAAAGLARQHGTPTFVLNSSRGADADSRLFYTRVKGEVERDVALVGFPSLTIVRPGLIAGERTPPRLVETVATAIVSALTPILPLAWRPNPAASIAQAMIEAALAAEPGTRVIQSEELVAA